MTQISFDAKQTNSSSKSFSILGAALRVPLIHNKTSLRIIYVNNFNWPIFYIYGEIYVNYINWPIILLGRQR